MIKGFLLGSNFIDGKIEVVQIGREKTGDQYNNKRTTHLAIPSLFKHNCFIDIALAAF